MKKFAYLLAIFALISIPLIFITSCEKNDTDGRGTLHLSITDSPIDALNLTGVFITITEIQYHHNGQWVILEPFEGPQKYNLMDLTHGLSEMLGSFELESGNYTQVRFILDAPVLGSTNLGNPGCYLEFADETTQPLFIPSGSQTGFKANGPFDVPVNGEVMLTADFDVRKSVVVAGASGKYILKPTIRLVADNQAGMIAGTVSNYDTETDIVVYVYEEGNYTESESMDPEAETPRFPKAISSDMINENGEFVIAFMAAGNYELVVTSVAEGVFVAVLGIVKDVVVTSQNTTTVDIDVSLFE